MKTVLITGGSGGIGRELALIFAKNNYNVSICYNNNFESASSILSEIQSFAGEANIVKGDVTKEDDVLDIFSKTEKLFGAPNILINNAGISHFGLLTDMTLAEWNHIFNVNVTSMFLCCKRALPSMISQKNGCIINMSSVWGEAGSSCEAAYSASKAAVIGLTRSLAKEEGPSGVRVNCITPGFIETPMNKYLSTEEINKFIESTPLCCVGTPKDVAKAALFLAESPFITGQSIGVNGGIN